MACGVWPALVGRKGAEADPFDVRILDQGRMWVDPDGSQCALAGMSLDQLGDVVAFVEGHVDLLYVLVLRREVGLRLAAVAAAGSGRGGGGGADRRRRGGSLRGWSALGRGPEEWLAATVLMRALRRAMAAGDPG